MNTSAIIETLKENRQDFEWYPTTDLMIDVVKNHIPADADSIMDIGAGDGRVLEKLATKCDRASLYGIEKSPILLQSQSGDIIPVGTDLWEQNLSTLPVDYIFCNPPYSEYVEWACKIISQGYARKAFLVIPQRWENDKDIAHALKERGADKRVIHSGNFYDGERQARAVIDIVEITYPGNGYSYSRNVQQAVTDPFDIWFDQNIDIFDRQEEIEDPETVEALARKYKDGNIADLVRAYRDEYTHMEQNYQAIFKLDAGLLRELGVDHKSIREGLKKKMEGLKIKYWSVLFKRLDSITSRLTTKSSKKILDKLTSRNTIDFTETNAYAVVLWAIKNANKYVDEQAVELFYDLATFDGVENYKSNQRTWEKHGWRYNAKEHTHYKLDYRIVVNSYGGIQDGNNSWNRYEHPGGLHRNAHDRIADVIAVFATLGFKSSPYSRNSLDREWSSGKQHEWYCDQENEDDILFEVRAYKNGNLHFKFKQEAIRALNIMVGRILKWVQTEDDVVEEMGYSREEAKKYFNHSLHIPLANTKLLVGGEPEEVVPEPIVEPIEKPSFENATQGKLL